MARLDRFVVRPRWWPLALLAAGWLAFTTGGLAMIASGELAAILAGVLLIAVFGVGGVLCGLFVARRGLSQLTLTPAGIELAAGGRLPWDDIEAVGTVRMYSKKFLAFRLRRYDEYLASVPPIQRDEMERMMRWWLRPIAVATSLFGQGRLLMSAARDVSSLETAMRWNRENFGWDYAFSPAWLDRPLDDFVDLLEGYRRSAASSAPRPPS